MQTTEEGETRQKTHDRRATHTAARILSALAIATGLGAGCGKAENAEPPEPEAHEVDEADEADEAEKWEPETVTPPKASGDHGHSHGHGPGAHSH